MSYLIIRLLSLAYLVFSAELQAQSLKIKSQKPSPIHLSKLSPLKVGKGSRAMTKIKPPLLVQDFFIILDPGHGGHDIGAQSISKPRYQEKSLNLLTARLIRDCL